MNAANKLLDKVREVCSIPSDNALAKRLDVTRGLVSGWRNDRYPIPDSTVAELCELAKLDAPMWLAEIHAERAISKAEKAMWSRMLTRLAAAAIFAAPLTSGAAEKTAQNQSFTPENPPGMYIMSIAKWLAQMLQPPELLTRSFRYA